MRILTLGAKCCFVLIIVPLLLSASIAQAQDDEDVYVLYYEDKTPNQLDTLLLINNICLEAVIRLNPELDINNIVYGDQIRIPTNEPCYDYDKSSYGWWNFGTGYPPRLKYYENGQWLDEPYYSNKVIYTGGTSVEEIAYRNNICIDDLLAENVLLQDFTSYKEYALMSLDVFIPAEIEPCNPYWIEPLRPIYPRKRIEMSINDVTPLHFVEEYNICPEDIRSLYWGQFFYLQRPDNNLVTLEMPTDALPCYSNNGQRLSYYDEMGRLREEPIYSDLEVYIATPGETLTSIAAQMGVCLVDLLRINNFPDMPLNVAIELFIPPPRTCPDNIEARLIDGRSTDLSYISVETNICPEDLLAVNQHFLETSSSWAMGSRIYASTNINTWILTPKDFSPCYWQYHPKRGDSIFDIERMLNVCYQEFRQEPYSYGYTNFPHDNFTLYMPYDAPPCYNEDGQRLQYPTSYALPLKMELQGEDIQYSDMNLHIFERADTVYTISKKYNVCVHDLLDANPILISRMPTGYPTFIPNTRPCYDQATGMPLIYEDTDGRLLPEPQLSPNLIFYGSQPIGYISYYYNVCINRIQDANQAKFDRESSYLGWIIPTDRPPCYDQDGGSIDYVCYDQPIDFTTNYRDSDKKISFNIDGSHCYDLSEPETIIWYQNKPYQVVDHENNMFKSRGFTAWCFGVSLEEINTINNDPEFLPILPYHSRAIPLSTSECYIQNPEMLDGQDLHLVKADETLISIADYYNKPHQWIANVNHLDEQNHLWRGQILIIPRGPTLSDLYLLAGGLGGVSLFISLIYWSYKNRRRVTRI